MTSLATTSTSANSKMEKEPELVLAFKTMVGVSGAFVENDVIRGVEGDELPWDIATADGVLTSDGHLFLKVTGVVFSDVPEAIRQEDHDAGMRSSLENLAVFCKKKR